MNRTLISCLAAAVWLISGEVAHSGGIYFAAGADAAAIQAQVDAFRADLGTLNPNVAGSFGSGRREINWDGVPDALSAPNNLPPNFFNLNSPRGAEFSGPASAFRVSGNPAVGAPPEFSEINATYPSLFTTFSTPRLFTGVDNNVVDVNFFVPGSSTPAVTTGFGSVFTDVDLVSTTSIEFFDVNNNSIGVLFVPNFPGNQTLSFLGVDFDAPILSSVRITSGNTALGPNETPALDVVVMDDFIYGEPIAIAAIPEPGSLALVGSGLLGLSCGLFWLRRRLSRA
jgi:hypothetical protein